MLNASSDLPEGVGRTTLILFRIALLFGLAPGGVCLALGVTTQTGELLPHRFTLTRTPWNYFHGAAGGLFSVALSLGSPPVAVSDHPVLWSSDFPPSEYSEGGHSPTLTPYNATLVGQEY